MDDQAPHFPRPEGSVLATYNENGIDFNIYRNCTEMVTSAPAKRIMLVLVSTLFDDGEHEIGPENIEFVAPHYFAADNEIEQRFAHMLPRRRGSDALDPYETNSAISIHKTLIDAAGFVVL